MLSAENFVHQETFRIRTYEINQQKIISIPAFVRLMQEAAMQHVIALQLSVWDLEPLHLAWVLIRKHIQIERYPVLGEQIRIQTHPSGFEKILTHRDYRIFDLNDQQIATASSSWLLMNTEERKMARIPTTFLQFNDLLPNLSTFLPRPVAKLPAIEKIDYTKSFSVQWHQLDFNLHLNNTFYLQWMLENLPQEILSNSTLEKMDLIYRAECYWQDIVIAETQIITPSLFLHRLYRKADGQELALGRSVWHK